MNVSPPQELEDFVQRRVAAGLCSTPSEVVRVALRLLFEQDQLRELRRAERRRQIAKGLESAEAGRFVDGESAMEDILNKLRDGRLPSK